MLKNRPSFRFIVLGFAIIAISVISVAAENTWGTHIFTSIRQLLGVAQRASNSAVPAEKSVEDRPNPNDDVAAPNVNNGKIVFFRGFGSSATIYIVDPASPGSETVVGPGSYPVWKPDGSAILFVDPTSIEGTNSNSGEIKLMNPDGTNVRSLATRTYTANFTRPTDWSQNGAKIAFIRPAGSGSAFATDIWIMNADGSGQTRLTNATHTDNNPSFSPDGTRIAFTRGGTNGQQIYTVTTTSPAENQLTNLVNINSRNPNWSPDGTKIVIESDRDHGFGGQPDIYVINPSSGAQLQRVTSDNFDDHHPVYSPDGTKIAWESGSRPGANNNKIFTMPSTGNPVTAAQQTLATAGSSADSSPSWGPGAAATPTPTPTPIAATLSFDGRLRDRVGKSDSGLPLDGESDGTFSLTLPPVTFTKSIASVDLKGPNGNEWDTIKQAPSPSAFWAVGVARGLDIQLENQADGTLSSVPVGNTGAFKLFIGDSNPSSLLSGRTFSVTVNFTDGTIATASTTITLTAADVKVSFGTAPPATTPFGSVVTFSYVVANDGPEVGKGVQFNTTVDPKLAIQSITAASACVRTGQAIICAIGDLGPGATKNIVISAIASQGGTATNTGIVDLFAPQSFDPNTANNSVSGNTTIAKPSVVLTGLEVTQGVQDMLNTMPLVAGRATYVRAYVKNSTGIPFSAGASLTVKNAATGATLGTLSNGNTGGTIPILTDPQRINLDDSFYFQLPNGVYLGQADWTTAGPVDISFSSNDFNVTCSEPDGNPDCKTRVTFKTGRDFSVKIFKIKYKDAAGNSYTTTDADAFAAVSELVTYFPVARLTTINLGEMNITQQFCTGGYKTDPATGKPTENGIGKVLNILRNVRANDCGANLPNYSGVCQGGVEDFYLGLLPFTTATCPTGGEAGGLGDQPTGATKVHNDNTGNVAVAAMFYDNRAHEIGHNFGFPHACTATAATGGCVNIVPTDGTLSFVKDPADSPNIYYGFDVFHDKNPGDTSGDGFAGGGFKDHARPWGPKTPDFMGYTEPSWPSSYNFRRLVDALTSASSAAQGTEETEPARPAVTSTKRLLLDGYVSLSSDTGTLGSVYTIDQSGSVTLPPTGTYAIRYDDAAGATIATYGFEPAISSEGGDYNQFSLVLPWDANTRRINILHNGQVIGTRSASAHAPTITVTSPNGGETLNGQSTTITWNASDSDGDALNYAIEYSVDAGATWKSLVSNWSTTSYTLDPTTLPATTQGLIRVTATDGFYSAQDPSNAVFTIPPHGPLSAITAPDNNHIYVGSQTITLTGMGIDSKDGVLNGAGLSWASNLNGPLGTGSPLIIDASTLVEGTHMVTLSARNSAGLTTTSAVSIKVFRTRPVFPASLSAGPIALDFEPRTSLQTLTIRNNGDGDLTWTATTDQPWIKLSATSGTAPANVDVTIIPGGLPYGNLTGKITLTSPEATNGPQVVNVNLAILQGATASLDGKVVTSDGRGLRNATVIITNSQGVSRSATTSSFGFYSFPDIAVGETYTVRIGSRLYRYPARSMQIISDLSLPDFVGLE